MSNITDGTIERNRAVEAEVENLGRQLSEQVANLVQTGNLQLAERLLREALSSGVDYPVIWNDLGVVSMHQGQPARAAAYLVRALENNVQLPEAIVNLLSMPERQESLIAAAECSDQMNDNVRGALERWLVARGLDQPAAGAISGSRSTTVPLSIAQKAREVSNQVEALVDEGKLESAEAKIRKGIADGIDHPILWNDLGVLCLVRGETDVGVGHLVRAIGGTESPPQAYENLLSIPGRPESMLAVMGCQGMVHKSVRAALENWLGERGLDSDAAKVAMAAIVLAPRSCLNETEEKSGVDELVAAGQVEEARQNLIQAIEGGENRPVVWNDLGILTLVKGDETRGIAYLVRALGHPDTPIETHINLLAMPQRYESLLAVIGCQGSHSRALRIALERWLVSRGLDSDAAKVVMSAISLNRPAQVEKNPQAISEQVERLVGLGDLDGAERILRAAIDTGMDEAVIWNDLGVVLINRQDESEGCICLLKALRHEDVIPETYMNLLALPHREESLEAVVRCINGNNSMLQVALEQWMVARGMDVLAARVMAYAREIAA